jgi:hypothetical protein
VQLRCQDRDVGGDLDRAVVLDEDRAESTQGTVPQRLRKRGAGVHDVPEAGVVVFVQCGAVDEPGEDGRHGEHVRDPVPFDELPGLAGVEARRRGQHAGGAAGHLGEEVDPRTVGQRGDHERCVGVIESGHHVAELVRHDEGQLIVRQDRRLGTAGRAGGEQEHRRISPVDGRIGLDAGLLAGIGEQVVEQVRRRWRAGRPVADEDGEPRPCRFDDGRDERCGAAVAEEGRRTAQPRQVRDLPLREPGAGRGVDRAQPEQRELNHDHLDAVGRVHQPDVPRPDAVRAQRPRQRTGGPVECLPGGDRARAHDLRAVGQAACHGGEQVCDVGGAKRGGVGEAKTSRGHRVRSRMLA